ncbi:MAG TPA: hypothetical protein VJK01_01495, partial [Candidatus Paceibacterota bacterium]
LSGKHAQRYGYAIIRKKRHYSVLGLPAISLAPCFNDTPQDNLLGILQTFFDRLWQAGLWRAGNNGNI